MPGSKSHLIQFSTLDCIGDLFVKCATRLICGIRRTFAACFGVNVSQVKAFINDHSQVIQSKATSPCDIMFDVRMCKTFIEECSGSEMINVFVPQELDQKLINTVVRVVLP